jgi:hypothetical protein
MPLWSAGHSAIVWLALCVSGEKREGCRRRGVGDVEGGMLKGGPTAKEVSAQRSRALEKEVEARDNAGLIEGAFTLVCVHCWQLAKLLSRQRVGQLIQ